MAGRRRRLDRLADRRRLRQPASAAPQDARCNKTQGDQLIPQQIVKWRLTMATRRIAAALSIIGAMSMASYAPAYSAPLTPLSAAAKAQDAGAIQVRFGGWHGGWGGGWGHGWHGGWGWGAGALAAGALIGTAVAAPYAYDAYPYYDDPYPNYGYSGYYPGGYVIYSRPYRPYYGYYARPYWDPY
jgi:hypothetical protein